MKKITMVIAVSLLTAGCVRQAYYDAQTVSGLEKVRAVSQSVYPTFATDQPDLQLAGQLEKDLVAVYERENGKADNEAVARQIGRLRVTYKTHLSDHDQKGKWSSTHMSNLLENFTDQLNLVVETENAKNRRK